MLFKKMFGGKDKEYKLTKEQIRILEDYKINYDCNIKELLKRIENEMLYHVNEDGLPNDEHYDILADIYEDIDKKKE